MSDQSPLSVERTDGVVLLTLALPERRNAMTSELTGAWGEAMSSLRSDPDLRCVVVTGAGRAFCAGGDLGWIADGQRLTVAELRARMLPFYRTWLSIRDLEVPTIAAVNGPAVGAGFCLALACDLRYASTEATFSAPFTSLGIHPGMAATWLLPEVAGLPRARELLLTGRVVSATDAATSGLVNAVVPGDSLIEEALRVAATIAAQAPVATRLTKVALAGGGHAGYEQALAWEALAQPITMATDDLREGIAAARGRRAPRFTGR